LAAGSTSGEKPLWVPDTENLKRERERTAIDRARDQRGQRLASKKSGGWGWLWWQLPLLAGLVGLGWMFKGEISEAFNGPATVACSDCDIADGSVGTDGSVDLADGSTPPKPKLPSEEAASDSFEGLDSPTVNSIEGSSESQEASSTEDSVSSGAVDGTVVDGPCRARRLRVQLPHHPIRLRSPLRVQLHPARCRAMTPRSSPQWMAQTPHQNLAQKPRKQW